MAHLLRCRAASTSKALLIKLSPVFGISHRKMSNYENYDVTAKSYDDARLPDGVDTMCKMLSAFVGKPLSEMEMLDAGCGTGNYSHGFLQRGVKKLHMIDANPTMLEQAREKTKAYDDVVNIQQMTLPNITFPSDSFDAVAIVQVLHHIDSIALHSDKEHLTIEDYPNLRSTLQQVHRVLRHGGVLMVDLMFEENVDSFWWTSLCPIAARTMKRTRIKKHQLFDVLREIGFGDVSYTYRPNCCLLQRDIYENIERIADPQWRGYLSQYKLVERSGELEQLIKLVDEKKAEGTLDEFRDKLNMNMRIYGHHVSVFAKRM